jgi:hypothetical protein
MEIGIEQEREVNLDWETNNRDTEVKEKKNRLGSWIVT